MSRKINVRFLVVLVSACVLSGIGLSVLYGFQVRRHAYLLLGQADRAEAAGHPDQAATYLGRYLVLAPEDTEALARYGSLLEGLSRSGGSRARAAQILDQVLRRQPQRDDARRRRARLAVETGDVATAQADLELLLRSRPDDAELEQLRARCEEANGNYAAAAEWLGKAIRHDPTHVEWHLQLAAVLRGRLNRWQRADEVMNALVAANGKSYQAYLARARYRQAFGSADEAAEDVARAQTLAPGQAAVLQAVAETAQAKGDLSAARVALRQRLVQDPRRAATYLSLATVEDLAGRPAEAIASLRQGLDAVPEPEHGPLLERLTELLIQGGQWAEAQAVLGRLRQEGASRPLLEYYQARTLFQQEQWAGSASGLQRLRQRSGVDTPLGVKVNLLLARCHERLGDPDQQLEAYRAALTLDPSSVAARLGLGSALLASGRPAEAATEFTRLMALREAPRAGWALLARSLFLQALTRPAAERDWKAVADALNRAGKATPEAADVSILHAQVLAARGQPGRARGVLKEARDRQPEQAALWVALADLAEGVGKIEFVPFSAASVVGTAAWPPGAALAALPSTLPAVWARGEPADAILAEAQRRLGDGVDLRLARLSLAQRRPAADRTAQLAELEKGVEKFSAAEQVRLLESLAAAQARLGNTREAERLWTELARRQPNDIGLRTLLFDLALQAGNDGEGQRLVADMKRLEGEDGVLWRYCEARRLVALAGRGDRGGLAEARVQLAEVAKRRRAWSRVSLLEAELEELEGRPDRALQKYQRALELGERQPAVLQQLIRLHHARGDFAAANEMVRQLQEQTVLTGDVGRLGAEVALYARDVPRALVLARQALAADPKNYRGHIGLGLTLWAAGERQEAEAALRQAVEMAGEAPEPWVALVHFLTGTGRKDSAEAAIAEARGKLPVQRAPLVLAHCYATVGRLDRAEEQYVAALAAAPASAAALRGAAAFYLQRDQFSRAEPHLRRLLDPAAKAPAADAAWARRNLATGLARDGSYARYQEALALLDRNAASAASTAADRLARALVLATHPGGRREAIRLLEELLASSLLTRDDQFLLVRLYQANGAWPQARALTANLLLAPEGKTPSLLAYHVRQLLRQDGPDAAQPYLAELERLEPESFRTTALRALVLKARGKAPEAVALVQAAPKGVDAASLAAVLEELGQVGPAEEIYRKQAADSASPEALLVLAEFLGRQKRLRDALDVCERSWRTCPPEKAATTTLAVLRAGGQPGQQDYDLAAPWFEAAAAKRPEAPLLLALADLRDLQGRYTDAAALYRQVLGRDAGNVVALNNLAWLLAVQRSQVGEALSLIDRALATQGPVAQLLDTRAVVYLAAGRGSLAVKDLDDAIAQAPAASRYFHLAQAHLLNADHARASEALRQAEAQGLTADKLHPLDRPACDQLRRDLRRK